MGIHCLQNSTGEIQRFLGTHHILCFLGRSRQFNGLKLKPPIFSQGGIFIRYRTSHFPHFVKIEFGTSTVQQQFFPADGRSRGFISVKEGGSDAFDRGIQIITSADRTAFIKTDQTACLIPYFAYIITVLHFRIQQIAYQAAHIPTGTDGSTGIIAIFYLTVFSALCGNSAALPCSFISCGIIATLQHAAASTAGNPADTTAGKRPRIKTVLYSSAFIVTCNPAGIHGIYRCQIKGTLHRS